MKVLVADAFSEAHLDGFRRLGLVVDYQPTIAAAELPKVVADTQILVVRSKQVSAAAIEAASALSLIVRAGAGVNTIAIDAASRRGVFVANCPGQNAIAVAELVMGLLVSLDRRIPDQVADLRAGSWNKKEYSRAQGLYGRTLGLLGVGAIGQAVAARARALGMNIVAWSRSLTSEKARSLGISRETSVQAVCSACDALSIHVAYTPETHHLVDQAALSALRPRALLINAARAEVIDSAALRQAIAEKGLRVALDVFDHEPDKAEGRFSDDIVGLPGVYGTHHVGASTEQAQTAIADETLRIVAAFVHSGEVPNCVNVLPASQTPARAELIIRHVDRVGVLAEVLGAVRRHDINVEAMHNTIFAGARAACARIRLGTRPSAELISEIRGRGDIIHVDVIDLPEQAAGSDPSLAG
ncbi:MAG: hydroxyacid dehydrogenase [Elusimicrobia bacterium]|nr:MAG: hydroxyacid dehydrogenase [Elusimicrobiota bacterium]